MEVDWSLSMDISARWAEKPVINRVIAPVQVELQPPVTHENFSAMYKGQTCHLHLYNQLDSVRPR